MRQQVQSLSVEHESLKKALNANDHAREIDDTEKRLKHYERSIFELREFVETKSRETDFEAVKGNCLKILDQINTSLIKKGQQVPVGLGRGAQAKW
jgi:intraflagellar transport protein 74